MRSKTDQIRQAWTSGDKIAALRIASKFFDRSPETQAFKRAWDAHWNPRFFEQLGRDPAALTAEGLRILAEKFKLPPT